MKPRSDSSACVLQLIAKPDIGTAKPDDQSDTSNANMTKNIIVLMKHHRNAINSMMPFCVIVIRA